MHTDNVVIGRPRTLDLSGKVFNYLTVTGRSLVETNKWVCECVCGKVVESTHQSLKTTHKSCGCKSKELRVAANIVHGGCKGGKSSPEYHSFIGMMSRCYNEKRKCYHDYGGRGIIVCNRWNPDKGGTFQNFISDMGSRPDGTSLDRIDFNGNYCPDNCRWATMKIQSANKRKRGRGSSKYLGVSRKIEKKKNGPEVYWVARISSEGKSIHIGRYKEEIKAAEMYDKHAKELHGEYAVLNFT